LLPGRRTARHLLDSRHQQHHNIVLLLLVDAQALSRTQHKTYMRTLFFSTPLLIPTMHLACPGPETRRKGQRDLNTWLTTSWRQGLGGFHSAGMLALHSHACPAFQLFVEKMCTLPGFILAGPTQNLIRGNFWYEVSGTLSWPSGAPTLPSLLEMIKTDGFF
jgi:hypothetical protein